MMLTMVPGATARASMSATTACMRKNGARRLTAMCCVEQLGRGVEQRAAGGQARRVHQAVDPAVGADHRGDAGLRLRNVGNISADKHCVGTTRPEARRQRLTWPGPAPGDRHRRALGGGGAGDGRPDPLRTAADQDHFAAEKRHDRQPGTHFRRATVRCRP